jgi:hypothetical protein
VLEEFSNKYEQDFVMLTSLRQLTRLEYSMWGDMVTSVGDCEDYVEVYELQTRWVGHSLACLHHN